MSPMPTQPWMEMLGSQKNRPEKGSMVCPKVTPVLMTVQTRQLPGGGGMRPRSSAPGPVCKQAVTAGEGPGADRREAPLLTRCKRETHRLKAGSRLGVGGTEAESSGCTRKLCSSPA